MARNVLLRCGAALGCALLALAAGACDAILGIESVEQGQACQRASDCEVAGACATAACTRGVCEITPLADGAPCGEEPGLACSDGACVCPADRACGPGGACVDTQTDAAHCGGCDAPCGPTEACDGGTCACAPQNLCDGACIDTSADPANCGACGRACQGVACVASFCEAAALTAQPFVTSLVLFQGDLYFALDGGQVRRVATSGGTVDELATSPPTGPYGLTVHPTGTVLFTNFGAATQTVYAVPQGMPLVELATGEYYPGPIVADGVDAYWGNLSRGIRRADLSAMPVVVDDLAVFAQYGSPTGLALDAQYVYATVGAGDTPDTGAVLRIERATGNVTELVGGLHNPRSLAIDNAYVFFLDSPNDAEIMMNVPFGSVQKVSKNGGPASVLVDQGLTYPWGIAVDDTYAYFRDGTVEEPRVRRVNKSGGDVLDLAKPKSRGGTIVVDDTSIYFADFDGGGQIYRAPK